MLQPDRQQQYGAHQVAGQPEPQQGQSPGELGGCGPGVHLQHPLGAVLSAALQGNIWNMLVVMQKCGTLMK